MRLSFILLILFASSILQAQSKEGIEDSIPFKLTLNINNPNYLSKDDSLKLDSVLFIVNENVSMNSNLFSEISIFLNKNVKDDQFHIDNNYTDKLLECLVKLDSSKFRDFCIQHFYILNNKYSISNESPTTPCLNLYVKYFTWNKLLTDIITKSKFEECYYDERIKIRHTTLIYNSIVLSISKRNNQNNYAAEYGNVLKYIDKLMEANYNKPCLVNNLTGLRKYINFEFDKSK